MIIPIILPPRPPNRDPFDKDAFRVALCSVAAIVIAAGVGWWIIG